MDLPLQGQYAVSNTKESYIHAAHVTGNRFSEAYLLRKVLRAELSDDDGNIPDNDANLLITAIHAVFLESGFVVLNSFTWKRVDRLHLPEEWPSTPFTLRYTLPELLRNYEAAIESVVLLFQDSTYFHYVYVYGFLAANDPWSNICFLDLEKPRFAPVLSSLCRNINESCDGMSQENALSSSLSLWTEGKKVLDQFWKTVKDGIVFPLLMNLCEHTGLRLPPCLINLPTDLKLQILESLNGLDVARMECVCKEMRSLCSAHDFWVQKYVYWSDLIWNRW